jgi:hypothetical protein
VRWFQRTDYAGLNGGFFAWIPPRDQQPDCAHDRVGQSKEVLPPEKISAANQDTDDAHGGVHAVRDFQFHNSIVTSNDRLANEAIQVIGMSPTNNQNLFQCVGADLRALIVLRARAARHPYRANDLAVHHDWVAALDRDRALDR